MKQLVEFLNQYKRIIAKPFNGYGSKDINVVTTKSHLYDLDITKYILEEYITGKEMRVLVLNSTVIAIHYSSYGLKINDEPDLRLISQDDNRDLKRISIPLAQWDPVLVDMALMTARVMGLKFAAVDFIITKEGTVRILEVNSTPGLRWFHFPSSGPAVDVARLFLEAIVDDHSQQINARSAPSSYIIQSNEGGL